MNRPSRRTRSRMKAWTSSTDTSAVKTYREAPVESNAFRKFARS